MTDGRYDRALSVRMATLLESPRDCLRHRPGFGVGAITVAEVNSLGFTVVHDPQDGEPAHALVLDENTKQTASELARKMVILLRPEGA